MSQSARTQTILRRFPLHLGADDPGKLFTDVVAGLGGELDVKSVQLGRVRRAHALGDAGEERDLFLLAGLHDLRSEDFELTRIRLAATDAAARVLGDEASTDDDRTAATAKLPDLLGLQSDAFPAWPDEDDDPGPAETRLGAALSDLASYPSELDLLRGAVESVIRLHREGNGTISALLGAGAAHLELELGAIVDARDEYWHVAECHDLMRLVRPELPDSKPKATTLVPKTDLLALEENPLRQEDSAPVDRRSGDHFHVLRSGYETVPATVRILGVSDRTVRPMIVNTDTGFGVAYTGVVGDGQELRFESDGRVTLDGSSVARFSYSFTGAVFADAAAKDHRRDFVFDDSTFAVTAPIDDGFDPAAVFPYPDGLLQPSSLVVGESRFAFFVREAHYGRDAETVAEELAIPVFEAGVFESSVFQPDRSAGAASSAKVGFSWQEHEPFAVRLWIPLRFSTLDVDGELQVKERLRLLLDRHRAAGIHVYVEYADDRWTVPAGVLRDVGSDEPLGTVIVGTALWAPETDLPT